MRTTQGQQTPLRGRHVGGKAELVNFGTSMFFFLCEWREYRAWQACMCCSRSSFFPVQDMQAGGMRDAANTQQKKQRGLPQNTLKNERPKPTFNHK